MTTTVKVSANHGWPVKVTGHNPKTGEELTNWPAHRVPAGEEQTFAVHSDMDIRVHEIQPGEDGYEPVTGENEPHPNDGIEATRQAGREAGRED